MSEILTTKVTRNESPELLSNAIDARVSRVRPMSTPLDQISRLAGARSAGSMKVDYYSVDVKPGSVHVVTAFNGVTLREGETFTVTLDEANVLSASETVMVPDVYVSGKVLVAYVKSASGKTAELMPVNAALVDGQITVSPLLKGTQIVRMGRAAGELDVQTPQFHVLPQKKSNFCQIFKAQVEESLLQRLADKEVGWSFSDQEEAAVVDMRLGMEKSFLFGLRAEMNVGEGEKVYFTGGIWGQAWKEFEYTTEELKSGQIYDLMQTAFTGGAGSRRKVLIGGSKLIRALHDIPADRQLSADDKETVWGIDFKTIVSKFGTLYVVMSEVFDQCGMPAAGMVIDPEYITKYSHIPFSAERISFHKQGLRNTEAVVLTEASCLVLRYPDTHLRIVCGD